MNWQRNSKSYNVNEAFVLDETFPKGKKEEPIRERSDSQSSVEDDDDPVANPRGLPTQAESIDFGLDDDANKGKPCRDCLMGCFTVFVVLATMTCVAILLYFILINIVFVESDTKTLTGALTIEGSVLLNETYEPDLADPESMAYREMENEFLSSMSGSFSNSTLADIYNGTNVERFEQGSIRIVFSVFLLSAPNDADTEAEVISEVQVTIGDGIYSGFFDVFDVIEGSLEITSVNQESGTTAEPPITASTEAPLEPSTASTMYSVTSQLMTSLSTLLSTPVTSTETVAPTTIPTTTRLFSTHAPTSPSIKLSTLSTTSTQSTSKSPSTSEAVSSTSSTVIVNSTSTVHLTTKPTTIPPSSTYLQTGGTTSSTVVNLSTTSSTTIDNSTGTFHFTNKLTTISLSSTSDTTLTTITPITGISTIATTTSPPTIPTTIDTVSTTTNSSLTKLTTIRQPSTDSPTSKTTPNTTSPSSSSSPTSSTVIDNSTSTLHLTTKPTTIPPYSNYSQTVGTTISTTTSSTVVNMSTPSSTTIDNSKGTFHFTTKLTNIPLSSTSDTTFTTIASTTRISTPATTTPPPPTITPTIGTVSTTTNSSLIKLTTIRQPSTDSSITTPNTTSSSSSSSSLISSAAEVNITRQPKIHPALPDTCGARPAVNDSDDDGTGRIVGGTQSAKGKWPWMGSLRDGTAHQCGAVLIHQQWAITAHHCVGFFDNIVLGDNDIYGNSETSPYRVQRNVQPFSNPDFDTVTDNGDIALVFLTEPVEFNDHVQPLCINTLETEMRSFNNCFVTGWGTDDILDQTAMRYLLEASIQMFNRSVCSEWYQSFHVITNQHICAGQENGRRDACSGDSGGPLQCQDDQGIWYLLGVVSFGQDCGQPRLPGVYTRVSTQISFLSGILDTNLKL